MRMQLKAAKLRTMKSTVARVVIRDCTQATVPSLRSLVRGGYNQVANAKQRQASYHTAIVLAEAKEEATKKKRQAKEGGERQ